MHIEWIKSPENTSGGCECRFIVVNRRVLNHMRNFQAAEKNVATYLGVHLLSTPLVDNGKW